jgi:hypothetical protein
MLPPMMLFAIEVLSFRDALSQITLSLIVTPLPMDTLLPITAKPFTVVLGGIRDLIFLSCAGGSRLLPGALFLREARMSRWALR